MKGGWEEEKGRKSHDTIPVGLIVEGFPKADASSRGTGLIAKETQATMELSKFQDKLHSATSRVKHIEELLKKEEDYKTFLYCQLTDQKHLTILPTRRHKS